MLIKYLNLFKGLELTVSKVTVGVPVMAATHSPAHSIVQSWLALSWCPLGVVRDRNTMDQQKLKRAGTLTAVDFIAHDLWKVLTHEWHRGQQIINRILFLITSCLMSKVVGPGITGWSFAGTGMATRVGLLTATNSFHSFKKNQDFLMIWSALISTWGLSHYLPQKTNNSL